MTACHFVAAALLALALAGTAQAATEIRRYETRADVAADGSARVTAELELAGATPGALRIPLGFAKPEDFAGGTMPEGATMAVRGPAEEPWVEVQLPEGVPAGAKLAFSFRAAHQLFLPVPEPGQKPSLPAGSHLLRHRFTNTQPATIGRYALTVLFPDDLIAHNIREQLPRPGRKEFASRVELDRFEGRQGALLQIAKLKTGDRTSMELELVPQRRSLAWLLILLPLALGYLVSFRDLVQPAHPQQS